MKSRTRDYGVNTAITKSCMILHAMKEHGRVWVNKTLGVAMAYELRQKRSPLYFLTILLQKLSRLNNTVFFFNIIFLLVTKYRLRNEIILRESYHLRINKHREVYFWVSQPPERQMVSNSRLGLNHGGLLMKYSYAAQLWPKPGQIFYTFKTYFFHSLQWSWQLRHEACSSHRTLVGRDVRDWTQSILRPVYRPFQIASFTSTLELI